MGLGHISIYEGDEDLKHHTGASLREQYHTTWVHIEGYIFRKKWHNILGVYRG